MSLEITFLGSGSAFTVGDSNYQSNILLRLNNNTLLFDAGGDIRFSMHELNLSYKDIDNVYVSHLHADHIGGMEWIALSTKFDPSYNGKPNLYLSCNLTNEIWDSSLKGGLRTIQTEITSLTTFFNVHSVPKNQTFFWENIEFHLVQTVHIISGYELMPCYGLIFTYSDKTIYITSDTQYCPTQLIDYYSKADVVFHDCETTPFKSGVHAHYEELKTIPDTLRKKIWLYHYNPGKLPDAKNDGFLGFVKKGQTFKF